jgi:hypothetical protein
MAWKKALFLGGAVLLLAACSDATAPKSQRARDGAPQAAVLVAPEDMPITKSFEFPDDVEACRSGYYVRSGDKDLCIELPEFP